MGIGDWGLGIGDWGLGCRANESRPCLLAETTTVLPPSTLTLMVKPSSHSIPIFSELLLHHSRKVSGFFVNLWYCF